MILYEIMFKVKMIGKCIVTVTNLNYPTKTNSELLLIQINCTIYVTERSRSR